MVADTKSPLDARKPVRVRYDPLALDQVPEVGALLTALGLGELAADEVTAHVGRNDNWAGPTTTGAEVFVKRVAGASPGETRRRFDRILAFDELTRRHPGGRLTGPTLLGADPDTRLAVFELLPEGRSGRELAADDGFDTDLCQEAGQMIAELHELPADRDRLDGTPHPLPPLEQLAALTLTTFTGATAGELEMWRLIQSDAELAEALRRLRQDEAVGSDGRPIHGDLRLDQFLRTPHRLYLLDWEEFRLGDPARDVGAFIGEWLYLAVHGIPRAIGDDPTRGFDRDAAHEDVLTHGVAELNRLRGRMAAFWHGYRSRRPVDRDLATRAAAFAGWHMFDRMFATASVGGARLPAADRAAAGMGRTILLDPAGYLAVLGLDGV